MAATLAKIPGAAALARRSSPEKALGGAGESPRGGSIIARSTRDGRQAMTLGDELGRRHFCANPLTQETAPERAGLASNTAREDEAKIFLSASL